MKKEKKRKKKAKELTPKQSYKSEKNHSSEYVVMRYIGQDINTCKNPQTCGYGLSGK